MNNQSFIIHEKMTEIDQQITESFHRKQLHCADASIAPEQNASDISGEELLFERRQRKCKNDFKPLTGSTCVAHLVMHFINNFR